MALIEEVLQREAEAPQKPWSFKSLLSLTLLFLREGKLVPPLLVLVLLYLQVLKLMLQLSSGWDQGRDPLSSPSLPVRACIQIISAFARASTTAGDFLRAAADYQRLLQLLPAVAASDAAAAVQAVLSAATKRAGIRQYDGLPDVFAASSQQKHHQQQRADAHLCRRQPNTEDLQPLSEGEGNTKTPCLQQGEQQLEELMLSTIAALESQGLNVSSNLNCIPLSICRSSQDCWVLARLSYFLSMGHAPYCLEFAAFDKAFRLQGVDGVAFCREQRLWAHVCSQLLLLYVKLGELQKVRQQESWDLGFTIRVY